jgi:putative ABC transport system ATP-binding protein
LKNRELTSFRREHVGFIFQSYNLLPSLSARDNAQIGAVLQKDPSKRIPVDEIFEKMGLKEVINSNIKNLSGGQQQRVSIARALAKNPQILFADEPTGALDSVTAEKIIELLLDINKKYKTTIVFVTHNTSLKKIATKIINVVDGKVSVEK